MRWKHIPEGEVIRKLSKGTRLHQEEPHGEAGGAGRGEGRRGGAREGREWGPCHRCPHLRLLTTAAGKFSKPPPLGFLWRPEVGKSYGELWTHCKVSFS